MKRKRFKRIFSILMIVMIFQIFIPYIRTNVYADTYLGNGEYKRNVSFSKDTNRSKSTTITIDDLGEIVSVSVDTGKVSYTVNGEKVTINVWDGDYVDYSTSRDSKTVTVTKKKEKNDFSYSISYNEGGYSGTLYKSGSAKKYVKSGSYTPKDTKYVTVSKKNVIKNYYDANGNLYKTTYSWGNTNNHPTYYYSKNGYTGTLSKTGFSISDPVRYDLANGGYYIKRVATGYYAGNVTRPESDTRVWWWKQKYKGTVYGPTQYTYYYAYNVTIKYKKKVVTPSNLSISDVKTNSLKISWSSNGNISGTTYQLYNVTKNKIVYNGSKTSYTETNLTPNTTYVYKVKATNPSGSESPYSSTVSKTTLAKQPTSNGYDNVSTTKIRLKWKHNGNPTNTDYYYVVQRASDNVWEKSGWTTGTSKTVTGLSANRQYKLWVKAKNKDGVETSFTYLGKVYTKSNIPSGLKLSNPTQNSIKVSWNSNQNPSGTKYQVLNVNKNKIVYEGTSTSFVDKNLNPDTFYQYKVRSINGDEVASAYSSSSGIYTLPKNITSNGIDNVTTNSMRAKINSTNKASGTAYYYRLVKGNKTVANSGWINKTTYTFKNLEPNTEYKIYAKVKNNSGELPEIYIGSKYTLAKIPNKPTFRKSTRTSNIITWGANNNPNYTIYELYAKKENGIYKKIYTGTSKTYTHKGLEAGTEYTYKVKAKNKDGIYTSFSAEATKITAPPVVRNLTVEYKEGVRWSNKVGQAKVKLSWKPVKGATGYALYIPDTNHWFRLDLGNTTTWDSSVAKIYPWNVGYIPSGTKNTIVFKSDKSGYDLADTASYLYKYVSGWNTDSNWYFQVIPYNRDKEESESPQMSNTLSVKLPNMTEKVSPKANISINDNAVYTNNLNISVRVWGYDDGGSKASTIKYSVDNGNSWGSEISLPNNGYNKSKVERDNFDRIDYLKLPSGDGLKTVKAYIKDNAGNSIIVSDTIYLDQTKPVGNKIKINNDATYTNSKDVILELSASDNLSGVQYMRFKTENSPWTNWVSYSQTYNYHMNDVYTHQGTNKIYVQFKDKAGNISDPIYDTIIFDDIAPIGLIKCNYEKVPNRNIVLKISASDVNPTNADKISGLNKVRFRELQNGIVKRDWTPWEDLQFERNWILSDGDGTKEIEMQVKDNANNIATIKTSILLDTLYIKKAEFTDIVNPPLDNPELPTDKLVNIKKGYEFTFVVETIGDPDYAQWEFNGQTGYMQKIGDNKFKTTLKIDVNNDSINNTVLPIDITIHRNKDNTRKYATLKVHVVGSAREDYDINLTN